MTAEVQNEINGSVNDSLLQLIVSASDKGNEFPLTLFVNGAIVSGILTGRRTYLNQFVSHFTTGWDEEDSNVMREAFGLDAEPEEEDESGIDTIRYIHLRDAKVFSPGQQPLPANGLLWRGKIAEVNGFSYGMFQTE